LGDLEVITYDPGGLGVSGLFAGSSGQSYDSIVESARSMYSPFFVSKTYCFALLFFKHEK
jgi:hypothetical protein